MTKTYHDTFLGRIPLFYGYSDEQNKIQHKWSRTYIRKNTLEICTGAMDVRSSQFCDPMKLDICLTQPIVS